MKVSQATNLLCQVSVPLAALLGQMLYQTPEREEKAGAE